MNTGINIIDYPYDFIKSYLMGEAKIIKSSTVALNVPRGNT